MLRTKLRNVTVAAIATVAVVAPALPAHAAPDPLPGIQHLVVIYQENHSFDNLYGNWQQIKGAPSGVDGAQLPTSSADAAHTLQVGQDGTNYSCLKQLDVNLTSPSPLATTCTDGAHGSNAVGVTAFANAPFRIDSYIPASAATCPAPGVFAANGLLAGSVGALAGGCTRDIVHRFYQEQYQLNGGQQNRYTTGSDAAGLTQGYYDTTLLPVYQYLNSATGPNYIIGDHFFQGAFGGSYANHQMLVSATLPVWEGAALNDNTSNDLHTIIDANGMPNNTYPLYTPTGTVKDSRLTKTCDPVGPAGSTTSNNNPAVPCGNYAINTIQPTSQPFAPGTTAANKLPPITATPNIGDRLSAAGVDWAWYSGGWDNAAGITSVAGLTTGPGWSNGAGAVGTACTDPNAVAGSKIPYCPDKNFQYHHQAFNYYATYAETTPGTPSSRTVAGQAHLQDEQDFLNAAAGGTLKPVSFVKPIGNDNEHPGYASEANGSNHLVNLIKAIEAGPQASSTLIVVTYDEFGGQWDHVPPPGQGATTPGPHDVFGPGTRIPALFIGPFTVGGVDHTSHDTVSILTTIEHKWNLPSLTTRDAQGNDFSSLFAINPANSVPESPWAIALPAAGIGVAGVALLFGRRRRRQILA